MSPPPGTLDSAERAITAYQEGWRVSALLPEGSGQGQAGFQPLAVGIPLQVRAFMTVARSTAGPATLDEAIALVARAARLVPYSADALNLEVVLRLARASVTRQPDLGLRAAVTRLEHALANEPENQFVLGNVASGYKLLLAPDASRPPGVPSLSGPDRAELQQRLDALSTLIGNR
jgi:hypothetical protein